GCRASFPRSGGNRRSWSSRGEMGSTKNPGATYHSRMKITKITAVPLAIPYRYGAVSHVHHIGKLDFCLVRVETDEGIVGWGDAFAYNCRSAVTAAVNDMIAPR